MLPYAPRCEGRHIDWAVINAHALREPRPRVSRCRVLIIETESGLSVLGAHAKLRFQAGAKAAKEAMSWKGCQRSLNLASGTSNH